MNFQISKFHLNEYPLFINALTITKMGGVVASYELHLLTKEQTDVILKACKEILEGKHHEAVSGRYDSRRCRYYYQYECQ